MKKVTISIQYWKEGVKRKSLGVYGVKTGSWVKAIWVAHRTIGVPYVRYNGTNCDIVV